MKPQEVALGALGLVAFVGTVALALTQAQDARTAPRTGPPPTDSLEAVELRGSYDCLAALDPGTQVQVALPACGLRWPNGTAAP